MIAKPAPTDQRAGVRPIAFVLDDSGSLLPPVQLVVRPEDLTRNEPARATVNQTLGRDLSGWVDHFGEGLPSCTIAGHTGWRYSEGAGQDGLQSFDVLNQLVVRAYPAAKQSAINRGTDPALVKLLFIDTLDGFAWSVVPTQFVLRRSKSRPLLFQYNITLQAVSTTIDNPLVVTPFLGNAPGGMAALDDAVEEIDDMAGGVESLVSRALGFVDRALGPIAGAIKNFVGMANKVFGMVNGVIRDAKNFVSGVGNRLISMARDLASVGTNIFRTINNIRNLPSDLRASIGRVAAAFNEVACIFRNSLRPRATYEQYTGLYGASNCSSTTGGNPASPYANMNAFQQMQPERDIATLNSHALSSVSALKRMDPVLAPLPFQEIGRHVTNISAGIAV